MLVTETENATLVWDTCLVAIKREVGEDVFRNLFKPIKALQLTGKTLVLELPSMYFYETIESKYVDILRPILTDIIGEGVELQYCPIIDSGAPNANTPIHFPATDSGAANLAKAYKSTNTLATNANTVTTSPFEVEALPQDYRADSQLNPAFTLDNFIEGDCNRYARATGVAITTNPGNSACNPLMIYGNVGLGKTHLVQAIGNEIKQNFPGKFVLYVSADNFLNQFIAHLKVNKMDTFNNFYLQVDVLIIDDVQFLAKSEKVQDVFFNVFNNLKNNGRQIIMTSDCPPADLKMKHDRYVSRFKSGVTVDLKFPDFETRVAIIQTKMQNDGIEIPDDVVFYVARAVETNVRELEGVLISMIAHNSIDGRELDINLAKQAIKNVISDIDAEIDIEQIQKSVSEYFQVPVDAMKAKIKTKKIAQARMIAMYFVKCYTNQTLKQIGQIFGGRDHTTVMHAIKKVDSAVDEETRSAVTELKKKLNAI